MRWKRSTPGEIVLVLPEVSRKGRATMYRFSSLFRFVVDVHVIDWLSIKFNKVQMQNTAKIISHEEDMIVQHRDATVHSCG